MTSSMSTGCAWRHAAQLPRSNCTGTVCRPGRAADEKMAPQHPPGCVMLAISTSRRSAAGDYAKRWHPLSTSSPAIERPYNRDLARGRKVPQARSLRPQNGQASARINVPKPQSNSDGALLVSRWAQAVRQVAGDYLGMPINRLTRSRCYFDSLEGPAVRHRASLPGSRT